MGRRSRESAERRARREKYRQSRPEILAALAERFDLLVGACALYDEQHFGQAKRIAVDLRVLLHDSGRSVSLLQQLEVKEPMQFEDSCGPLRHGYIGGVGALAAASTGAAWNDDWVPIYEKRMMTGPLPPKPFEPWWTEGVLADGGKRRFGRRELVLGVSNQDGGAHVDPELDADYAELSRRNSVGLELATAPSGPWKSARSPVPASLRQIAHEVIRSCQWWLPDALRMAGTVGTAAAGAVGPLDRYVGLSTQELYGRNPDYMERRPA